MAKFARVPGIVPTPALTTFEGGQGFKRTPKMELLLLAASNPFTDTFYEREDARHKRFRDLVTTVTKSDPVWVQRFVRWLRSEANVRSASVAAACEYVAAGGPNGRSVVASACLRADEPGEVLAYWRGYIGRNIPQPVKRGVADATTRLYSAESALKNDGTGKVWRFADVLRVTHPKPSSEEQAV